MRNMHLSTSRMTINSLFLCMFSACTFIKTEGVSRLSSRLRIAGWLLVCLNVVVPLVATAQGRGQSTAKASAPIVDSFSNGLKYYIQRNPFPSKRAYIWLAVKAGSVHEDDDQLGFAHFLEHMAFNGTKHFPGNTLIDVVEKAGMSFGGDLNAYTTFDETVYQLQMPTDDPDLLKQGLQILEDWASGGILNDSLEVVGERGVVLGEWRARVGSSAGLKKARESLARIFGKGSRYIDRFPIGDPDLIRQANPAALKRFYNDWYRPDLMAIMIVGDFDQAEMERTIKQRFGKIPKAINPRQFELPVVKKNDLTTVHLVEERTRTSFDMEWPAPDFEQDPKLAMRNALLERILMPYINRIATNMRRQERPVFPGGGVGRSSAYPRQTGYRMGIRVAAHPDSIVFGFSSLLSELERIAQHGLPKDVLEREKAVVLRSYEQGADRAAANPSRALAGGLLLHFQTNGKVHLWNPQEALHLVQELLPTITNQDIANFASRWREQRGRIVTVNIPKFSGLRVLTDTAVHKLLDSISNVDLVAESPFFKSVNGASGGLATTSNPGTISNVEKFPKAGVTRFTLSNGAKVIHKETGFNPDDVLILAHSDGGHSLLPDSLFASPGRLVGLLMTQAGGVGGLTHDQLGEALSTTGVNQVSVELNAFEEQMYVRGSPRELETLFQLMNLTFTNPTFDTASVEEWRRHGREAMGATRNDILAAQTSGGERRLALPSPANVPFIDVDEAMTIFKDRFGDASDFTFMVVGAVDAETVRPLLEKYIANLPSTNRQTRERPRSFNIPVPSTRNTSYSESPRMLAERAQLGIQFRGNVELNSNAVNVLQASQEQARVQTLSLILSRRLRNRLREEIAVTYSVGAPVTFYRTPEQRYMIGISLLTAPEVMDSSTKVVWEEISALYKKGPTAMELDIAHEILTRRYQNAMQGNAWWAERLRDLDRDGIPFSSPEVFAPMKFTSEQIRDAAVHYLPQDVYVQGVIVPTAKVIADSKKAKEKKEKGEEEEGEEE